LGKKPRVFRNTELIYNNRLAEIIESTGRFDAVITEGADHILGHRSSNFVYRPAPCSKLRLLLKNYSLSDDIAFRFSNPSWKEYPLMADKFAQWINNVNGCGHIVNLFMDYETFGEHQWRDTRYF
jgi:alpha-amylase